jgi:hypothetical protein
LLLTGVAQAQTSGSPELEACKATGLMALKERSPSVKNIILDADSLIVSNTDTEVGDTPVRTIIMGEAIWSEKEQVNRGIFSASPARKERCC